MKLDVRSIACHGAISAHDDGCGPESQRASTADEPEPNSCAITDQTWAAVSRTAWYAVRTKPGAESRVSGNLSTGLRLEVLNPQARACTGRRRVAALFPQYIFACFGDDVFRAVRFTRGVVDIVAVAGRPAAIDESIITAIRSRVGADGLVALDPDVRIGDRVCVTTGPFREMEGVFQRTMKSRDRVVALLALVQGSVQIVVPQEFIRPVRLPPSGTVRRGGDSARGRS